MNGYKHIGVIILAAGASTRLGQPKQLKKFRGKKLLQHMIDICHDLAAAKVMVLGANHQIIELDTDKRSFEKVINEDWSLGISSSIIMGLNQVLSIQPETKHVLILLSDQPFVSKKLIHELLEAHLKGDKPITASLYKNIKGVPAVFSKAVFKALKSLKGDEGAKKIIITNEINLVHFEQGSIDIDTPEDYQKLIE